MRKLLAIAALFILFYGCITLPGGTNCSGKQGQDERDKCYSDAAVAAALVKNDRAAALAFCDNVERSSSPFGSERDLCYMRVAEVFRDPSICENIDSLELTKSLCKSKAEPARSPRLCAPLFALPALFALALFSNFRRA